MNYELFSMLRFELVLLGIIFLLLLLKLLDADKRALPVIYTLNTLLLAATLLGFLPIGSGQLFHDFFITNELVVLEKTMMTFAVLLISLLSTRWFRKRADILLEFFILLLSSLLGGYLMLSSGHVLMLYLGLEMSTLPICALSNFNKTERRSSEAGIKFILSSAFSSGIMLFGISMLYGAYGNLDFHYLRSVLQPDLLTLLSFAFMMGGFLFKLSAVPFHLWAADVYEGSPLPVTNYLSVVSKGMIVFVFVSILVTVFENLRHEWVQIITIVSILSMTVGNLFALRQTNMKRLLAFSSISQVGFVLVGVTGSSIAGVSSTLYFMLIYMVSNISCFGIIGAVADSTRREDIDAYCGFYRTNRFMALMFGVSLFALAGVPPTSGFFGKLFLLVASLGDHMYLLVGVAGVNLVLSLYNYLRIARRLFIDPPREVLVVSRPPLMATTLVVCCGLILTIGFLAPVFEYIARISRLVFV